MTTQTIKNSLSDRTPIGLPHEVQRLLPREREIATIVYSFRAATAQDVSENLSSRLSSSAVRSMLNRLVAKRILQRILSGRIFVYLPALTSNDSRTLALKRFADDYFAGSVQQAATTMRALLDPGRFPRR